MKNKGFTLIELLVVISIIGLLSSVALASFGGARDKARNSKIKQEMQQLRSSLELSRGSDGRYPFPVINPGVRNIVDTNYDTNVSKIFSDILSTNGGQRAQVYADADGVTTPVTKFAIYSALLPVNSIYWCIDSEGKTSTGQSSGLAAFQNVGGGSCRIYP